MQIKEGMDWPPMSLCMWKMCEHSAWYSGDAEILANFYSLQKPTNYLGLYKPIKSQSFWGRQIANDAEVFIHVPIAGDIAETSANMLFAESPLVKIIQSQEKEAKQVYTESQSLLDDMILKSGLFSKILEGAEACAAIGGVYLKIAYDEDLSKFPIPVVMQADKAIPEFKFGILIAVTFWKTIDYVESGDKVYRLLERYEKGSITNELYLGTNDKLGNLVDLADHEDTADLEDSIDTGDKLFAVYIPNVLPNRLDRSSYMGRSDYSGIEGLMDALDETFSSWMKDIILAQAKILLPEGYLKKGEDGTSKYNYDKMLYVEMDIDPVIEGNKITPQQFKIRADEFEKTTINLMERIITSAGYSPQSFGLNIQGRAESGTALNVRERKSFATKGKKENYWQKGLDEVVNIMIFIYNKYLGGKIAEDSTINISFSDGITNNLSELATSIKMLGDAISVSTDTKVRMLHPEWEEEQIKAEVELILEENNIGAADIPEGNMDIHQLDANGNPIVSNVDPNADPLKSEDPLNKKK